MQCWLYVDTLHSACSFLVMLQAPRVSCCTAVRGMYEADSNLTLAIQQQQQHVRMYVRNFISATTTPAIERLGRTTVKQQLEKKQRSKQHHHTAATQGDVWCVVLHSLTQSFSGGSVSSGAQRNTAHCCIAVATSQCRSALRIPSWQFRPAVVDDWTVHPSRSSSDTARRRISQSWQPPLPHLPNSSPLLPLTSPPPRVLTLTAPSLPTAGPVTLRPIPQSPAYPPLIAPCSSWSAN